MLSHFSMLLVYIIAGLALSTAVTPMGLPHHGAYNDGLKLLSYPGSSYSSSTLLKYDHKPYLRSYAEEKKYPEQKPYPRSYSEEKKYP